MRRFEIFGILYLCSILNFAQEIVVKFATFLYSRQNSRSSDICGVLMFVAKFAVKKHMQN